MVQRNKKTNASKSRKCSSNNSQVGGAEPGTAGNVETLVLDIFKVVESTVKTIIDSTELIVDLVELPGDLGTAFKEPAAPGVENT